MVGRVMEGQLRFKETGLEGLGEYKDSQMHRWRHLDEDRIGRIRVENVDYTMMFVKLGWQLTLVVIWTFSRCLILLVAECLKNGRIHDFCYSETCILLQKIENNQNEDKHAD